MSLTNMEKSVRQTLLLSVFALGATASDQLWAFDCNKANTPTEKTICSDAGLRKLDAQLNRDYKIFQQSYGKSGNHNCLLEDEAKEQKAWLKQRDACGTDSKCIEDAYQSRIDHLGGYARMCVVDDSSPIYKDRSCHKHAQGGVAIPTAPTASTESCAKKKSDGSCDTVCERIDAKNNPNDIERYNQQNLNLSDSGADFMKGNEAIGNCMYNDSGGYATIGYGHLIAGRVGIKKLPKKAPEKFEQYRGGVTDQEADRMFNQDVQSEVGDKLVRHLEVKLNQCQTDALISFIYNYGFYTRLKKAVNSCNWDEVAAAMKAISTSGGKIAPGLVRRREEEVNIFLNCKYPPSHKPARLKCCTYQTRKDTPDIAQGEYRARCHKGCREAGFCYGV
ncbi:MAG: glycoside hydrolase family protein [Candidatus Igneacidithiobacillus chanchocoensis]